MEKSNHNFHLQPENMQVGRDLGNSGTLWALSAPVCGRGFGLWFYWEMGTWSWGVAGCCSDLFLGLLACCDATRQLPTLLIRNDTNNTQVFLVLPM